jgi:hypothetical protein
VLMVLAGTIVALLAVALVLEPVFRPVGPSSVVLSNSDDDDITPEQRRRDLALAALKEIEFDKATGKLSDEDYARLYERYAAEAVSAMKATDGRTDGPTDGAAAEASVRRSAGPSVRRFCEECGSKLEGSGKFCAECGTKVAA